MKKLIKNKSELMDSFVEVAIANSYSDTDGGAERLVNETINMYNNLPNDPKFTIPGYIAKMIDEQKTTKLKFNDYDKEFYPYFKWSKEFDKQHGDFASIYLMQAYLNPFIRDLVKIEDGEIQ